MKEKLFKIITYYGVIPQLKYFQSEVFELNEAIINEEFEHHEENILHIAEEIADVQVMLNQFKEYYKITDEEIKKVMEYKIKRQLGRIENERKD